MSSRKADEWERQLSRQNSWPLPQSRCLSFPPFLWLCVVYVGVCIGLYGYFHMFIRMHLNCVQVWIHVYVHLCGSQRTISSVFLNLFPHYFWDRLSLTLELIHHLDWLANRLQRFFSFFPNHAGIAGYTTLHLAFCEGARDLNSSWSSPKETLPPPPNSGTCFPLPKEPFLYSFQKGQMAICGDY